MALRDLNELLPHEVPHALPGILASLGRVTPINGFVGGTITTGKKLSFICTTPFTLRKVRMAVGTCGTAGSTVPDVNKNGTTVLTAAGVTALTVAHDAADGTVVSTTEIEEDEAEFAVGDVLSFDIDTAPTNGADIDVAIEADLHL